MIAADVSVVPGTADPITSNEDLVATAQEIGYPIMLKAAAGGGGKGMRIVATPEELVPAFEGAQREAISSFADDAIYIEKAIIGPRALVGIASSSSRPSYRRSNSASAIPRSGSWASC